MAVDTSLVTNAPASLRVNYAMIGWYHDGLSTAMSDAQMHTLIDHLKSVGFGGIEFGMDATVSSTGTLQTNLTFDRMWALVDYAKSKGLAVAIAPDWVMNGNASAYIPDPAIGQSQPAGFSMQSLLQSYAQFFSAMATTAASHGVDLLLLNNGGTVGLATEYLAQWTSIIADVRSKFHGALSTAVTSQNRDTGSVADKVAIWPLLDGITLWVRETLSKTPVEDLDEVISRYIRSPADGSSLVNEVIALATTYGKPVLLTTGPIATDRGLDPWDATPDQLVDHVIPTNYPLAARQISAVLEVASQLLYPFVSAVSVAGYEPWSMGTWSAQGSLSQTDADMYSNFKYISLILFPELPTAVLTQYLDNPAAFKPTSVIQATRGNETLYTRSGDHVLYLNGGFDVVHAGTGRDTVVMAPKTVGASVTFDIELWTTAATDQFTADVFLGNTKIGTVSLQANAAKLAASPAGVFADPAQFTFALPTTGIDGAMLKLVGAGPFTRVWNVVVSLPEGEIRVPQHNGAQRDPFTFGELDYTLSTGNQPASTIIDGGPGVDLLRFEGSPARLDFDITRVGTSVRVSDKLGRYVPADLINVERIVFGDSALAWDLEGNAGHVARLLGAVFGPASVHNAAYAGIGLQLIDGGMSYQELASLAVDAHIGAGATSTAVVNLLYTNVVGAPPDAATNAGYALLIDSGAMTRGQLAVLAADSLLNAAHIDLVGLAQSGLAYTA
jgi:hypothetical protein